MHQHSSNNSQQATGPILVRGKRVTPGTKSEPTVIRRNGFVAEIICSQDRQTQIFHYVVQKENSTGIVYWGQEVSRQRAMECVEDFLQQYDMKQA